MGYRGSQWEVTAKVMRRIDQGFEYDFAISQLPDINDYGWGRVYSWFTHLAETKDGFDVDDFENAFRAGWSVNRFGPLDEIMLARSVRQAKSFLQRRW